MCGIVGYVGHREAVDFLIEGLHRLEYRGYDSSGVATITPDGEFAIVKTAGRIDLLEDKLTETPAPGTPQRHRDSDNVIKVRGIDDLMVYRAKCCNPIRGEAIVGYVTRGKGVAVHSNACPNVQNLLYDAERKIEVEWARSAEESFPVRLAVHTDDRPGLLNQLTSVLADEDANIRNLEAKTHLDQDSALVEMTVDVRDKKQLERLVGAMRRISGVRDVERHLH